MEDTQKRYIDKVLEFYVRGTKIEDIGYGRKKIIFPTSQSFILPTEDELLILGNFIPYFFYDYCKNMYGLTEDEINYMWVKYEDIIRDKVYDGR